MSLCVVFDIDGVLIDVEDSFYQAISKTVLFYVENVLKKSVDNLWIDKDCIQKFKNLGSFNDDWDVTAGILYCISFLFGSSSKHVDNVDIESFLKGCSGEGLGAILDATGGLNADWVLFDKTSVPDKTIHPKNLVKRIFQEYYLGEELFQKTYEQKPAHVKEVGTIHNEKKIFSTDFLKEINNKSSGMAIATGREKQDALYSLQKFGFLPFFDKIVTLTDVGEKMKKPHPQSLWMIDAFFDKKGLKDREYVYIGDQIDDMLMCFSGKEKIKIEPRAFMNKENVTLRQKMLEVGVTTILKTPDDLKKSLKEKGGFFCE
ncbi:hypothetical protein AB834_06885 [PVC group bacterium (ex Bugula neritina AB1)]|nr:hypothetical protein AB834_06885 [PVC group bacterium (ex Bugula neritina AB1)]